MGKKLNAGAWWFFWRGSCSTCHSAFWFVTWWSIAWGFFWWWWSGRPPLLVTTWDYLYGLFFHIAETEVCSLYCPIWPESSQLPHCRCLCLPSY